MADTFTIQPQSVTESDDKAAEVLTDIQNQFGMIPNIFAVMSHHPPTLAGFVKLFEAIHTDLEPRLREIAYLKASTINDCEYCVTHHRKNAQEAGVSEEEIDAIASGKDESFEETEQLVLQFADQLTRTTHPDADLCHHLCERLGEKDYVALTAVICTANWTNRFNHACGVQLP